MIIAALDTSCGASFALQKGEELLFSGSVPLRGRDSDRELVPWIMECLRQQGFEPADVVRWTVGVGPGSFSGIRVGVAFVKGVCAGREAQYRGLPSSLALALAASEALGAGDRVGVLHDARREQVILTRFRKCSAAELVQEGEPVIASPDQLAAACRECARLTTPHEQAVRPLLPAPMPAELAACDAVDAGWLLAPPGWAWPDSAESAELSCEPVYVRPAAFVKPKPAPTQSR